MNIIKCIWKTIILGYIIVCTTDLPVMAQQIITVSGKALVDKTKKSKFPWEKEVDIYAFNSVEAARNALKMLENSEGEYPVIAFDKRAITGPDGYYEIQVAENGALIFHNSSSIIYELHEVNYAKEINVTLPHSPIKVIDVVAAIPLNPTYRYGNCIQVGNKLFMSSSIYVPYKAGKANRRIVLQPYLIHCQTGDTVAYLRPWMINGKSYRVKKDRKNTLFPCNRECEKYILNRHLTKNFFNINWHDTVSVPDVQANYRIICNFTSEDCTQVFFQKDMTFKKCRTNRPLRFLDYESLLKQMHGETRTSAETCVNKYLQRYYQGENNMEEVREREKIFEMIKTSSPLNHAIICIAMNNRYNDEEAQQVLSKMPQNAITHYLQAIVIERIKGGGWSTFDLEAAEHLSVAIKTDPKMMEVLEQDNDVSEDSFEFFMDMYGQDIMKK